MAAAVNALARRGLLRHALRSSSAGSSLLLKRNHLNIQHRTIFGKLAGDSKAVVPTQTDEERALAHPINFDVGK